MKLCYFGGAIKRSDVLNFKKMVFRSTRGKAYTHFFELEVPCEDMIKTSTSYLSSKVICIVIFEEGLHFKDRLTKVCNNIMDYV